MLASVVDRMKLPEPEPAPAKASPPPVETAAEPAIVNASILALLVALALTLAALMGVSVAVALMVCVISLTATEAPIATELVPSSFSMVIAAPPESALISELSSAVSDRSPEVLTVLPAPISARASVSTMFTVTEPAPVKEIESD